MSAAQITPEPEAHEPQPGEYGYIDWEPIQEAIRQEQAEFDQLMQDIKEAGGSENYFHTHFPPLDEY